MHTFEFNNKKLSDIGAVINDKPSYVLSVKELDFTALPYKSGDIITDKKRFKNLSISYKVSSYPLFCSYTEQEFVKVLSEWLLTSYDYTILRDTYNPGYFRKAVCTGISNPVVEASNIVQTTVTFNCDPFLYSNSGLRTITINSMSAQFKNPEKWDSEPIIKLNGLGDFIITINDDTITAKLNGSEITIDKPNENVYDSNGISCNDKVTAIRLPYLKPGINTIAAATENGSNFSAKIIPNWRRL